MMHREGANPDDVAATVISINRSVIFWENVEVCRWFEALQFDRQTVEEVRAKRINGMSLISMVNSDRLEEIGITRIKRTQLLWNLERRINKGDAKAGTAVDPRVFLGVAERLAELQEQREPYRDESTGDASKARATPMPTGVGRGGGVPEAGPPGAGDAGDVAAGGEAVLDLLSMDIGGGGVDAAAAGAPLAIEGASGVNGSTSPQQPHNPLALTVAEAKAAPKKKKKKKKLASPSSGRSVPPGSGGGSEKKTFNLIDLGDEGDAQWGHDGEQPAEGGEGEEEEEEEEEDGGGGDGDGEVMYSEGGSGPEAMVFEVVFPPGDTPNILLEESQPGNKLAVKSFPKKRDGTRGSAELCGRIEKGDFLVAANSIRLEGFAFQDAIRVLTSQAYPMSLRFRRVPKHLRAHNLEDWSMNALRTVLIENGAKLTGLERHNHLVAMARKAFWNKPVPLPPAAPHVAAGTAAIINGETSVCGWLLMRGPHDRDFKRLFCDLHGSELLYHVPKGAVTGESAGYDAAPAGSVDMSKVKLVATTRSSEEGHKDLRMVNEDDQVYLLSFAKEDALTQWMRKLNTALIIGPGARTSGVREPSAPYLASKSHKTLTVMWLPPRQPYLNSVHSFQLAYKLGVNPLKEWTMATDEAHSTKFTIKGLKAGERYYTKVRAMHELDRGQMVWGDWSVHSKAFVTDRGVYRNVQPAKHIWVLVHGLRGDTGDMKYLGNAISSRHGTDAHILISQSNSAPFKTLDGISKGGTRLFEEVMQTVDSVPSALYISFIGHGVGGLYIRYALRLLDEAGVFEEGRLCPINYITLGTPHLGTLKSGAGMVGMMVDVETSDQLAFKDGDMNRGGTTRDSYGVGHGHGQGRGPNPRGGVIQLGAEAGGRPPILAKMTGEEYLAPLRQFQRRILYANSKFDSTVEYPSASIRMDDPYVYVPDTDMDRMCSPHYNHVLASGHTDGDSRGGSLTSPGITRGPSGSFFPTNLAAAAPDPGMWEIMAQVLESLGWERVDIFNDEGLLPHKDLVVANAWLNSEGMDIVRHLVDNAPNKPPDVGLAGGGSRRNSVDEDLKEEGGGSGGAEIVEDLISGLDDDTA